MGSDPSNYKSMLIVKRRCFLVTWKTRLKTLRIKVFFFKSVSNETGELSLD